MLSSIKTLYRELDDVLSTIEDVDKKQYVAAVFSEIIVLKSGDIIEKTLRNLCNQYTETHKSLLAKIVKKADYKLPRETGKLTDLFSPEYFNIDGLAQVATIMSERHTIAHTSIIQTSIPWRDLFDHIILTEEFLKTFQEFIEES